MQCKSNLEKKKKNPILNLEWTDIYESDNATPKYFTTGIFLEKDKTGLPFQINIRWSAFIGLINWRVCAFLVFEPFSYWV